MKRLLLSICLCSIPTLLFAAASEEKLASPDQSCRHQFRVFAGAPDEVDTVWEAGQRHKQQAEGRPLPPWAVRYKMQAQLEEIEKLMPSLREQEKVAREASERQTEIADAARKKLESIREGLKNLRVQTENGPDRTLPKDNPLYQDQYERVQAEEDKEESLRSEYNQIRLKIRQSEAVMAQARKVLAGEPEPELEAANRRWRTRGLQERVRELREKAREQGNLPAAQLHQLNEMERQLREMQLEQEADDTLNQAGY